MSEWEVSPGVIIPSGFQTPACKEAIEFWLAYKIEKRQGYKPRGLKALMATIAADFTPETLIQSVRKSAASGYQGLFPPNDKPANGNHSTANVRPHRNDFIGGGDIWDAQVAHDIATRPEGFGVQANDAATLPGMEEADPGT